MTPSNTLFICRASVLKPLWRVFELVLYCLTAAVFCRSLVAAEAEATTFSVTPSARLKFGPVNAVQLTNVPTEFSIAAESVSNTVVTNVSGPFKLNALGEAVKRPRIVISEVVREIRDAVEFINASGETQNLNGWKVFHFDGQHATQKLTFSFTNDVQIAPGEIFVLREPGFGPVLPVKEFAISQTINWVQSSSGISAGVLVQDAASNIVDFVSIGVRQPDQLVYDADIAGVEWRGTNVIGESQFQSLWSRQRVGSVDTGSAADWAIRTPQIGQLNSGLNLLFADGFGRVAMQAEGGLVLTNGAWSGPVRFGEMATNVFLEAWVEGTSLSGRSESFRIRGIPLLTAIGNSVTEGDGVRTNVLEIELQVARAVETVVTLMIDSDEVTLPETVVIPAGETRMSVPVTVLDDALLDGSQKARITAVAEGTETIPGAITVLDNESAALTISGTNAIAEGAVAWLEVSASEAPGRDVELDISFDGALSLRSNAPIVLRAGTRSVSFEIQAADDQLLNSARPVAVVATVPNWSGATNQLTVLDNEARIITVSLPASVKEGAGILLNAGRISLSGYTETNLVVALNLDSVGAIRVPSSVTVVAGASNAPFNITVIDDTIPNTNMAVLLNASAEGFESNTATTTVINDDPASFAVLVPFGGFTVGVPFNVTVRALGVNDEPLTNRSYPVSLELRDAEGSLQTVVNRNLPGGVGTVALTPAIAATGAYIRAEGEGATGESRRLNILNSLEQVIAGAYRDVVVLPGTADLYASVASDAATNANEIVRIDTETGLVETWLPAGNLFPAGSPHSGKLAVTPDGEYVFAITDGGSQVRAWKVSDRSLAQTFPMPQESAQNIAVATGSAGTSTRLLVSRGGWSTHIFAMDGNEQFHLVGFESGIGHPENPETFYVFYPYGVWEWQTTNSGVNRAIELVRGPFQQAHVDMAVVSGRLFTIAGTVIDTETRNVLAELPIPNVLATQVALGRLAADLTRKEVLRVYPDGAVTRIESFGVDDLQMHNEAVLPVALNQMKRMLMVSTNRLALLSGTELRFVRWPARTGETVDLAIKASSTPEVPRVGQNWEWRVKVENGGPGNASDVKLRLPIPEGLTVTNIAVVGGEFAVSANNLLVHWPWIAASNEVEMTFTLVPSVGGFVSLNFSVHANEDDLDDSNNGLSERRFVGVGTTGETVTKLRLPVRDLVYDAANRKIYALELNDGAATNTMLYEIDEATFLPTVIRTLPGYASHLRVSRDGNYLHSAVRLGRSALRINLAEPGEAVEYALGGENFNLHSLEVSPLDSAAVVVAGTTEVQEGVLWETTIELFNAGEQIGNQIRFQPQNGTYYGFLALEESGEGNFSLHPQNEVRRLRVDASGVVELGRYVRLEMTVSFALVDGIMYTAFSDEIRAASGKFLRAVPTEARNTHAAVMYQAELDRLVYLQMRNGGTMLLQAFDRASLAGLGRLSIPAQGPANSMIDLGGGRMAIAFPSGEVFLVSSGLIGGVEAETDLAVTIQTDPVHPKLGEDVVVRVIAQNNGTNSPVSAGLTVELPFGFNYHFTNVTPRPARIASESQSSSLLLWTNILLAPGTSLTNTLRGTFADAGHFRLTAGIADRTTEAIFSNNIATLVLPISLDLQSGGHGVTSYQILGAGYDAIRGRIIAATSATSAYEGLVLAIDPENGLVVETFDFGTDPTAMTLADDSDTLYVAIDGGTNIARASLSTGEVEAVFSANFPEVGEQRSVYWLGANPGRPDQVFVRADNGLALFSADQLLASTNYFYGPLGIYGPNGLVHPAEYAPHPINRVQFKDGAFLFSQGGPEFMNMLRAGAGLLVSGDGRIVEAESFALLGQVNGSGAAVISGAEGIIYKFGFEPDTRTVRAFDILTQSLLWESVIRSNAQGIDGIEAGPEYLAYRIEDSRLMIVRKKGAETNAPADLRITLGTETTWQAGAIGEWDITLHNSGANQAAAVRVDLRLPAGFRAVQVKGASVIADRTNHLSLQFGTLAANSGATLQVSALADRAYTAAEVVASVRSSAVDLNRTNNTARFVHPVNSSSLPNLLETLDVPGSDLVYDRAAKKLYVAGLNDDGIISSNLTVLDPFTGQAERTIQLQAQPVKLAISDGGDYLYVALNGGTRIERYELPSLEFDLGFDLPASTWFKVDMFVPVGMPRTVVISLHGAGSPSPAGAWVYDDDQPRPQRIDGGWNGVTFIEPGAVPDELIAVGDPTVVQKVIRKYRITTAGLEFVEERPHTQTPFALAAAGNSALTWPSELYDAVTLDHRGTLTNGFDSGAFHPEAIALSQDGIHAVLAANVGMAVRFEGFRTDAMTLSGTAEIPFSGKVRALTLWENDGIAALAGNSLILGRLDLAAAPLQIRQFDPNSMRVIFLAAAGRRWILQRASSPIGPWSEAAGAISSGGVQVVTVANDSDGNSFFRVVLEPPL